MALTHPDSRFLGIETRGLRRWLVQFGQYLQAIPPLSWLVPDVPVRLLRAQGDSAVWLMRGAQRSSGAAASTKAKFMAVDVPESLVLLRELNLPMVSADELSDALALDARTNSPFPPHDLVWGYRCEPGQSGSGVRATVAIGSRKQLEDHVRAVSEGAALQRPPEAWVLTAGDQPVVLAGFGEAHRQRHAKFWTRVNLILAFVLVSALIGIAVTPSLQLRLRALEARDVLETERARVEPAVKKRADLMAALEQLQDLRKLTQERLDPLGLMDRLTQLLPDDTALLTLTVQSSKITLTGQTANAAALMKHLSSQPGVKDVKAPAAAVRPAGATKDSFTIELMLDPVTPVSTASAVPTAVASAPASAVVGAPASAPASAPVPVASQPASAPRKATP